jgi:signal peptidase II
MGLGGSQAPPPAPPPEGEGRTTGPLRDSAPSPLGGESRGEGAAGLRLFGRFSALGLAVAAVVFAVDQAHKWWMLGPFDIAVRQPVSVAPFFDLVLAWNRGISYGWFAQESDAGRWALVGISIAVTVGLWLWLARAHRAVALGLVIGGALGNTMDRIVHGAVADFFLLHGFGFSWYVFNIADTAIFAGVVLLLYESFSDGEGG